MGLMYFRPLINVNWIIMFCTNDPILLRYVMFGALFHLYTSSTFIRVLYLPGAGAGAGVGAAI